MDLVFPYFVLGYVTILVFSVHCLTFIAFSKNMLIFGFQDFGLGKNLSNKMPDRKQCMFNETF